MPWHYPKVFEAALDGGREFQLLLFLIFKRGSALKPIPIVRPSPETERRGIPVVMLREAERYPRKLCAMSALPPKQTSLSVIGISACAKSGHRLDRAVSTRCPRF
jgi:hypothetical protein